MLELPSAGTAQELLLPGAAGAIETLLAAPRSGPARGIAVICHPHPLMGGAMTNKVAYTLASTALKAGLYALRFNFRGVGRSEGVHDHARGETDDVVTVVEALRAASGGQLPLLLGGFSFGGHVALRAAHRVAPALQISIAPPLSRFMDEGLGLPPAPGCPWLLVHSRDDEVVPFAESDRFVSLYDPPPTRIVVDGAGHFFHGRLTELADSVLDFVNAHWPSAGPL